MNTDIMYEALGKARDMFKLYAELHHAKGTVDSDAKAKVNEDMVATINEALSVQPAPRTHAVEMHKAIKAAFEEGCFARSTYNDRPNETVEEVWLKSEAKTVHDALAASPQSPTQHSWVDAETGEQRASSSARSTAQTHCAP